LKGKGFKRLLSATLVLALVFVTNTVVFANNEDLNTELMTAYENVMSYAQENNIPSDMTFDIFAAGYSEQEYSDVQAYEDVYYSIFKPELRAKLPQKLGPDSLRSSVSMAGEAWYYNIGTSLPQNANPSYSKYNLLTTVQKGDIVFEANGGFGITAHVAIVEGLYYDNVKNVTYIRVIEAIADGVVRSCLDDTRVDDKEVSIYRVTSSTNAVRNNAVNFCIGELGSSYNLDFAKDTSSSETDWYCSELVWASYKNQNINIETTSLLNEPGITPRDIMRSSKVSSVAFK
jgi:hypothetical protein